MNIDTTYPAHFINITDVVQHIQHFKILISLFKLNKQLCIEYSLITNKNCAQVFGNSSNISMINVSCSLDDCHIAFKSRSKWLPVAAVHNQSLLQNDCIAVSVNSCDNLPYIANKAAFSLAELISWVCTFDSIPALCPMHDDPLDLDLVNIHQNCSLLTCLTEKNALLTSNSCSNILIKLVYT